MKFIVISEQTQRILNEANCGECVYKYSCGYTCLRRGELTDKCCLGLMSNGKPFYEKTDGAFWHPNKNKMVSEQEVQNDMTDEYHLVKFPLRDKEKVTI